MEDYCHGPQQFPIIFSRVQQSLADLLVGSTEIPGLVYITDCFFSMHGYLGQCRVNLLGDWIPRGLLCVLV